ncbi:FecR family protein [Sunxiuqinia rutila]|uniref:FecR family protein n=1 Tax=Sunxiuqinia rutila TaxID=1397841 RepID=UPI003D35A104
MEERNKIYRLIELECGKLLNEQQEKELNCWLEESSEHQSDYEEVRKVLMYSQRLGAMKKIDVSNDLKQVKAKIGKENFIRKFYIGFQRVAAFLIVPLMLYSIWTLVGEPLGNRRNTITKSTETSFGVRSQIQLSDGTHVWLNSGSKLFYPEEFSGDKRVVKLLGEAYFQVQSDKNNPFYVEVGNYMVKATGTRFNISNYPDDIEITTFLESGRVELVALEEGEERSYGRLLQGQKAVANKTSGKIATYEADGEKHLSWMNGELMFRRDSIKDVARRLGHWFNAEVVIDDKRLEEYVFTATFTNESLEEALRLLSYSSDIEYEIINNQQRDDSSFAKRKVIIRKGKK